MASAEKVAKAKITSLKIQVDALSGEVKAYDPKTVTLQELTVDLGKVARHEDRFDEIRNELYLVVVDPADIALAEADILALEKTTKQTRLQILKLQGPVMPPPPKSQVKLKPIDIPTFAGKFEEWPAFHDLFQSMVHNRTDISGAQKLTYLQAALRGEAAALVSSYEHTDANYQEAWDQLEARYDVKREIVFSHVSTFLDFKPKHSDPDFGLRALVDAINKCVRCLKAQTINVDDADPFIIVCGIRKLDPESRQQWAMHFKGDLPKITEFTEFLELRARSLTPLTSSSSQAKQKSEKGKSAHHVSKASKSSSTSLAKKCPKCAGDHYLSKCPDFKKFTVDERLNYVQQKKLCVWCLTPDHSIDSCTFKKPCNCGEKHHYTLHKDPVKPQVSASHCAVKTSTEQVVLLGTLLVNVKDRRGQQQQCRVFVDNGSESHFISEYCLNRLGFKTQKVNVPLNGIGHEPGPVCKGQVSFKLESQTEDFSLEITALVLPKFAGLIPTAQCQAKWTHLENVKLSDPQFFRPHYTDILLGAAKSGHILTPGVIKHPSNPNAPVAINTRFGWMLNGEAPAARVKSLRPSVHHVTTQGDQKLDNMLHHFWEQEEPESHPRPLSSHDVDCEAHFLSTHSLNPDGTYTVQLPFRPGAPELGSSRHAAVRRFQGVEKRLLKNPSIKAEYDRSIKEYISLGYMEPVPSAQQLKPPSSHYYMPHHEVVKESSTTTKVRPVFDASARTDSGISLNQVLYTGPKLQVDLFPLLLRFMSFPIAISADIWKFYPQTSVHESQRDFQRLVWREGPDQPLKDYRMTRVTFGVSAAPFLAIRAFHELANRVKLTHPRASQVIKEEFLVDNLLSGAKTVKAAVKLKDDLLEVMQIGGLKLTKFISNSQDLLQSIPPELRDPAALSIPIDENEVVKTIGILWNPGMDTFSVKIQVPEVPAVTTKRNVLSAIARTFDPLGFLSPVTIYPKILIQKLWKAGLGWDDPLPPHFQQEWNHYCDELPSLQDFSLPRNAFAAPDTHNSELSHQLHGFSDGSDQAHAACIYIRTEDSNGRATVKLLTAKTRVNPIEKTTTPRSELCGALLLSSLVSTVLKALDVQFESINCWTDSTVVLGRLAPEKKLPVFERNRIQKIVAVLPPHHWRHVKGDENPADAPSRGIPPRQLLNHPLWLHGPPWLKDFISVPVNPPLTVAMATVQPMPPINAWMLKCSSFSRMTRTISYILRFIRHLKAKKRKKSIELSANEVRAGVNVVIKFLQRDSFAEEIRMCSRGMFLPGRIKSLAPFICRDGILRVGGRLRNSEIHYSKKHPALLPKNNHVTDTIARYFHQSNLHAGPTLLLSIIRDQYWPVDGLHLVKRVVRQCVVCHRNRAVPATQQMGQLPASRVNPSPTFSQSGLDYAGPFHLALRKGRKPPIVTSYVALFVCMATKATHLELVSDLTTAAFIAALQRFISRRGLPNDIYSDEGKNFVGAKRELDELLAFVNSDTHIDAVKGFLAYKGINFHTNPPAAPHHGGLWEAAVKSMKYHLRRVMGTRHLTVEEFSTLLCQVEGMLNSRPLIPLSADPNDTSALTPGHFLIGRPLSALPYPDLGHLPISQLDRWQTVQSLSQHIWGSWKRAYLSLLQSRPKWHAPLPNLEPGTLVLVMDKDGALGPQQWKLGRIVEVFPCPDGMNRVCDVRTNVTAANPKGSILRRPIVKLSPLPIQ